MPEPARVPHTLTPQQSKAIRVITDVQNEIAKTDWHRKVLKARRAGAVNEAIALGLSAAEIGRQLNLTRERIRQWATASDD